MMADDLTGRLESEEDPLAIVFVVDAEKTPDGRLRVGREDLFDAAALGLMRLLRDERDEVVDRIALWRDEAIRKIVKRARGAAWHRALAVEHPHVVAHVGDASVMVLAPLRPSEQPRAIREAQVSGLQAEPSGRPARHGALTVHVDEALHMSTGKTIAQLGHAVQLFAERRTLRAERWITSGCAVCVVPGIPAGPHAVEVRDAGFTEVPSGSLTAVIL
jgi:hypothetical protein